VPGRQLDSRLGGREHAAMLVLASASPRRRELLRWLVPEYALDSAVVDESPRPGEAATVLVDRLARAKAEAVARRHAAAWVLAADTIVELGGEILGKPADAREAAAMLARLSGREHRVLTGFALLAPGGAPGGAETVESRVRFRTLDPLRIDAYVATGEPLDKAGAYAVQGAGAGLIERVEGSFTNVIGLPLTEVGRTLERAGFVVR
jgi:septum formation protein